uniref:hypothetical protein n=1 Tax=Sphingomonas sp. H160509 TaxID=2955313 RepID=UPI003158D6C7
MPEWLYEAGLGEARAALMENDEIVEAAIELDDGNALKVGLVARARLVELLPGRRGRVALDGGEALINHLPPASRRAPASPSRSSARRCPKRGVQSSPRRFRVTCRPALPRRCTGASYRPACPYVVRARTNPTRWRRRAGPNSSTRP